MLTGRAIILCKPCKCLLNMVPYSVPYLVIAHFSFQMVKYWLIIVFERHCYHTSIFFTTTGPILSSNKRGQILIMPEFYCRKEVSKIYSWATISGCHYCSTSFFWTCRTRLGPDRNGTGKLKRNKINGLQNWSCLRSHYWRNQKVCERDVCLCVIAGSTDELRIVK